MMIRPTIIIVTPERDKGILANPVTLKEYPEFKMGETRGSYGMERGGTEVGFELDHMEPSMTFRSVA
jgi:hypothetical protein